MVVFPRFSSLLRFSCFPDAYILLFVVFFLSFLLSRFFFVCRVFSLVFFEKYVGDGYRKSPSRSRPSFFVVVLLFFFCQSLFLNSFSFRSFFFFFFVRFFSFFFKLSQIASSTARAQAGNVRRELLECREDLSRAVAGSVKDPVGVAFRECFEGQLIPRIQARNGEILFLLVFFVFCFVFSSREDIILARNGIAFFLACFIFVSWIQARNSISYPYPAVIFAFFLFTM